MSVEELILSILFNGPKWYDPRELRCIAMDVRKLEDRVKQLEKALDLVRPYCSFVHHSKKHQHAYNEPCPVVALIEKTKKAKP